MKFSLPWKRKPAQPLAPKILAILREFERQGTIDDGDPLTLAEAFDRAEVLGLISGGGGFSYGYHLTAKGERALSDTETTCDKLELEPAGEPTMSRYAR